MLAGTIPGAPCIPHPDPSYPPLQVPETWTNVLLQDISFNLVGDNETPSSISIEAGGGGGGGDAPGVTLSLVTLSLSGGAAGHRRPASTALAGSRPHAHRAHCLLLPALVAEQALHVVRGARDPTPGLAAPPFHRACVRGLPDAASGSGRYAFVWHRPVLCRAVPCRAVLRLHARIRGVHRAVREARQKSLPQCLPSGALQHLAIAMEFGDAGSLLTYLQRQPGRRLAGQNARWLFQQLVIGLSYTHHRVSGAEGAVWLVQRRVDAGLAHIVCHVALCPASGVRRLAAHAGRRLIGQRVIARAPQCGQR